MRRFHASNSRTSARAALSSLRPASCPLLLFLGGDDPLLFQRGSRHPVSVPFHLLDRAQVFVLSKKAAEGLSQHHSKVVARFLGAGDRRIDPALVLRRPDFGRSRTVAEQCAAAPMQRVLDEAKGPHQQARNKGSWDDVEL